MKNPDLTITFSSAESLLAARCAISLYLDSLRANSASDQSDEGQAYWPQAIERTEVAARDIGAVAP